LWVDRLRVVTIAVVQVKDVAHVGPMEYVQAIDHEASPPLHGNAEGVVFMLLHRDADGVVFMLRSYIYILPSMREWRDGGECPPHPHGREGAEPSPPASSPSGGEGEHEVSPIRIKVRIE
jgi:hypothetical protein